MFRVIGQCTFWARSAVGAKAQVRARAWEQAQAQEEVLISLSPLRELSVLAVLVALSSVELWVEMVWGAWAPPPSS